MKQIILLLGLVFLTACAPIVAPTSDSSTVPPAATATDDAATFTDPFAYCAAVGTLDTPDERYVGAEVPASVLDALQIALGTPADAPDGLSDGVFWRCMAGQLYACAVGANLPCTEPANTDETPSQAEVDFCAADPDAEFIPAYVTGHNTIYQWRCSEGAPAIAQQVFQVDEQGFIADIWYPLTAPTEAASTSETTSMTTTVGMPNPASENCTAQGGTLTIEQRGDGGEFGVCTFEDNLQCEEWALMRGECPTGGIKVTGYLTPAARYCAITGGDYTDNGTTSAEDEQGICVLPSGSTCAADDYYNGQCSS